MFEKSPDQLASLKVQMMDKTAYCTQRHIILLDDTAKNLKEGMFILDSRFRIRWS
jgi:ariadne-1